MHAAISHMRITGVTVTGGRKQVSNTIMIMIMEKPKPAAPRTMPARKMQTPVQAASQRGRSGMGDLLMA